MTVADFWEKLYQYTELPFDYEDVEDVVFFGGTAFIKLKNKRLYGLRATIINEPQDTEETVSGD
jgi:hypothetical protein